MKHDIILFCIGFGSAACILIFTLTLLIFKMRESKDLRKQILKMKDFHSPVKFNYDQEI